jgi:hypothetical protein
MAASCYDNPRTQGLPKVQIGLLEHQTKRANHFGLKIREGSDNGTMVRAASCLFCFETVGKVINPEIDRIASLQGVSRNEIVSQVSQDLATISKQYTDNHRPVIPFDDPLFRIAYLYGTLPINAHVVEVVFDSDSDLQKWFRSQIRNRNGTIKVCTLGGGPGTEILGLAKWIEGQPSKTPLTLSALVTDKFLEWRADWLALRNQINQQLDHHYKAASRARPLSISGRFQQVDVESSATVSDRQSLSNHDINIVSYLVSSIFNRFDNFFGFMTDLVKRVPRGSKFLFIDRAAYHETWKNPIRELASKAGMQLSEFQRTVSHTPHDLGEQKTDLGVIFTEIQRSPRLRWDAFWVVGTKV